MRARKGDEIICACGRAVGTCRNDLKDGAIISGRDIAITLPAGALDDRNRYLCPDCKKVVARHLGDQWIVLTRQGWLRRVPLETSYESSCYYAIERDGPIVRAP